MSLSFCVQDYHMIQDENSRSGPYIHKQGHMIKLLFTALQLHTVAPPLEAI